MDEIVTNHIQRFREEAGLTQEILAHAVGVTRQTVIAIEKGNYAPSVVLALKLATHFKTPVEKLFIISKKTHAKR